MSKHQEMHALIRHYKDVTGKREIDMKEVAKFAHEMGWPLPSPSDPLEILAKEFSRAAREEVRHDKKTKRPYRANHAFPNGNSTLWIDIDEAPRGPMLKSFVQRREQMVGDALQLTFDMDHWNSVNPIEEPIRLPMDFTDDVEWRKNSDESQEESA